MPTHRHRIFDLVLESSCALPELPPASDEPASLFFELQPARDALLPELAWTHQWRVPSGQITLSHGRQGETHRLSFPRLADFSVSGDGKRIAALPMREVPQSSVRHLLLDQVLPRVISHFRSSVLHASAVALPGGAVAFLGDTGWGKSTLGLSFEDEGYPLLGDDAMLVESRSGPPRAIASYPGARLWDDSFGALAGPPADAAEVSHYSSKKRVAPPPDDRARDTFHALRAIYLLDDPHRRAAGGEGDAISLERVRGTAAVMALVEHCFHLDLKDKARVASQFDELAAVVSGGCAFFRIGYPRVHARLGEVRAAILEALP